MIDIAKATSPDQLDQVRHLIRSFVDWHRLRHREDLPLIDRYFDPTDFETELAALPGYYAPPRGSLLLARYDGDPAGCVGLREIGDGACEMKRMFVDTRYQGKGIGRALTGRLIGEARETGYSTLYLDTSFRQVEAQALYQSFGFRRIEPYYELPEDLRDWLVFMALEL
jgi:GNAT superfamily N-acetyltransferase